MFGSSVLVRERSVSHPGGAVPPEFLMTRDQWDRLQSSFERYEVTCGLYRNQPFQDRLFPVGAVLRIIGRWEFDTLEKGLMQRIDALNLFVKDVYGPAHIVKDKVVPADFLDPLAFREDSMLDSLDRPHLFRIREVVEYLYAFWVAVEDTGEELEVALAHFGRFVERLDLASRLGHDAARQRAWKTRLSRLASVLAVDVPVERIPDAETPEERAEALIGVNRLFQEAYTHGS